MKKGAIWSITLSLVLLLSLILFFSFFYLKNVSAQSTQAPSSDKCNPQDDPCLSGYCQKYLDMREDPNIEEYLKFLFYDLFKTSPNVCDSCKNNYLAETPVLTDATIGIECTTCEKKKEILPVPTYNDQIDYSGFTKCKYPTDCKDPQRSYCLTFIDNFLYIGGEGKYISKDQWPDYPNTNGICVDCGFFKNKGFIYAPKPQATWYPNSMKQDDWIEKLYETPLDSKTSDCKIMSDPLKKPSDPNLPYVPLFLPFCKNLRSKDPSYCVECLTNRDCNKLTTKPRCQDDYCSKCENDLECMKFYNDKKPGESKVCDYKNGECVAKCNTDDDCNSIYGSFFKEDGGKCVKGHCVQCNSGQDCITLSKKDKIYENTVCDPKKKFCVQCYEGSFNCKSPTPICDISKSLCIAQDSCSAFQSSSSQCKSSSKDFALTSYGNTCSAELPDDTDPLDPDCPDNSIPDDSGNSFQCSDGKCSLLACNECQFSKYEDYQINIPEYTPVNDAFTIFLATLSGDFRYNNPYLTNKELSILEEYVEKQFQKNNLGDLFLVTPIMYNYRIPGQPDYDTYTYKKKDVEGTFVRFWRGISLKDQTYVFYYDKLMSDNEALKYKTLQFDQFSFIETSDKFAPDSSWNLFQVLPRKLYDSNPPADPYKTNKWDSTPSDIKFSNIVRSKLEDYETGKLLTTVKYLDNAPDIAAQFLQEFLKGMVPGYYAYVQLDEGVSAEGDIDPAAVLSSSAILISEFTPMSRIAKSCEAALKAGELTQKMLNSYKMALVIRGLGSAAHTILLGENIINSYLDNNLNAYSALSGAFIFVNGKTYLRTVTQYSTKMRVPPGGFLTQEDLQKALMESYEKVKVNKGINVVGKGVSKETASEIERQALLNIINNKVKPAPKCSIAEEYLAKSNKKCPFQDIVIDPVSTLSLPDTHEGLVERLNRARNLLEQYNPDYLRKPCKPNKDGLKTNQDVIVYVHLMDNPDTYQLNSDKFNYLSRYLSDYTKKGEKIETTDVARALMQSGICGSIKNAKTGTIRTGILIKPTSVETVRFNYLSKTTDSVQELYKSSEYMNLIPFFDHHRTLEPLLDKSIASGNYDNFFLKLDSILTKSINDLTRRGNPPSPAVVQAFRDKISKALNDYFNENLKIIRKNIDYKIKTGNCKTFYSTDAERKLLGLDINSNENKRLSELLSLIDKLKNNYGDFSSIKNSLNEQLLLIKLYREMINAGSPAQIPLPGVKSTYPTELILVEPNNPMFADKTSILLNVDILSEKYTDGNLKLKLAINPGVGTDAASAAARGPYRGMTGWAKQHSDQYEPYVGDAPGTSKIKPIEYKDNSGVIRQLTFDEAMDLVKYIRSVASQRGPPLNDVVIEIQGAIASDRYITFKWYKANSNENMYLLGGPYMHSEEFSSVTPVSTEPIELWVPPKLRP